tara:strand:+ start:414 stop:692 length:279 start_codon:yes stop_codon:yes gene_type:complete
MPYSNTTQKKYGENPLSKRSAYKMKGYSYPGTSPAKKMSNSEKAKADGASEATINKLKDIEAGEKKKSELTDPVKIARVDAKLNELQPKKIT